MKYRNANSILPDELVEILQKYVQGEYIYVPVKDKFMPGNMTSYQTELEKRDAHIYTKHLEGISNRQLAESYHLSESSIRRIIIKQKEGYLMISQTIEMIMGNWDLQNEKIKQIYDTAWQIGEYYVLKIYHDLDMLKRNLSTSQILDSMNIPVGKIVPTNKGEWYIPYEGAYYFLSEKLHGSNLVKLDHEYNIAIKMGEIIADLHIAFQRCENASSFWNSSLLEEMNGWVMSNFEKHDWKFIGKDEYEVTVSKLEKIYHELPIQLIHRDVHFGNFLFDGNKFSGYIDFDLSQRNIRIFDLCYFVLGLLSEEEEIEITKDNWFYFVKNVFDGYGRKLPLSAKEKLAVPYVMECIELLFAAWFLEENDVCCAKNAYDIFEFVRGEEGKIWDAVGVDSGISI